MAIQECSVTELKAAIASGATVIDVREVGEYQGGHVPEAINIPLSVLPARIAEAPPADVLYLTCRSGARSADAARQFTAAGRQAINVAGGTLAWVDAGLPLNTPQ